MTSKKNLKPFQLGPSSFNPEILNKPKESNPSSSMCPSSPPKVNLKIFIFFF